MMLAANDVCQGNISHDASGAIGSGMPSVLNQHEGNLLENGHQDDEEQDEEMADGDDQSGPPPAENGQSADGSDGSDGSDGDEDYDGDQQDEDEEGEGDGDGEGGGSDEEDDQGEWIIDPDRTQQLAKGQNHPDSDKDERLNDGRWLLTLERDDDRGFSRRIKAVKTDGSGDMTYHVEELPGELKAHIDFGRRVLIPHFPHFLRGTFYAIPFAKAPTYRASSQSMTLSGRDRQADLNETFAFECELQVEANITEEGGETITGHLSYHADYPNATIEDAKGRARPMRDAEGKEAICVNASNTNTGSKEGGGGKGKGKAKHVEEGSYRVVDGRWMPFFDPVDGASEEEHETEEQGADEDGEGEGEEDGERENGEAVDMDVTSD